MTLEDAINVARRLSVRNEPDLLQESYGTLSQEECEVLASHMKGQLSKLPVECRKYVGASRKKEAAPAPAKSVSSIAFEGMPSGQAAAAKASRERGLESHAVLQRRYTNTHKPKKKDSS